MNSKDSSYRAIRLHFYSHCDNQTNDGKLNSTFTVYSCIWLCCCCPTIDFRVSFYINRILNVVYVEHNCIKICISTWIYHIRHNHYILCSLSLLLLLLNSEQWTVSIYNVMQNKSLLHTIWLYILYTLFTRTMYNPNVLLLCSHFHMICETVCT